MAKKMRKKRIIAHFQPQADINGNAVDIDGAYDLDVTELVLAMDRSEALEIFDFDYGADQLWQEWVSGHPDKGHDGPFSVTVEDAIKEFFA